MDEKWNRFARSETMFVPASKTSIDKRSFPHRPFWRRSQFAAANRDEHHQAGLPASGSSDASSLPATIAGAW